LREQGLVQTRREAQTIRYSLVEGPVARLIHTLHDIYCPAPVPPAPSRRSSRAGVRGA
jgi:DNA-binding transcriptional ArsR family regulator